MLLSSPSMVCRISWCTHRHECPFDRFLNLCTFLWHAALSLPHCHTLYLSVVNNDGKKNVFSHKNRITLQMSSWEQVSNGIATGHQLIAWIASDRLFCYPLCVITKKSGTSHQKILVNAGLRQSYRTKEPYLFNMFSIYHMTSYTPVSALPEMLWTTRGLLLCRRKSQISMAPSTRVM